MEIGEVLIPRLVFALDRRVVLAEHGFLIRQTLASGEIGAEELTDGLTDGAARHAAGRPEVDVLSADAPAFPVGALLVAVLPAFFGFDHDVGHAAW